MSSRERISKLLKEGEGNLKLLYSHIIDENFNQIRKFLNKNKKFRDLSNSIIFCDILKNNKRT